MRKFVTIAILFVMVAMVATTTVNAMGSADLANKLYAIGEKYGLTSADKVRIERYFNQYPATDAEAEQLIAKANEAAKVMDAENVTDITKLSANGKEQLKTIATEAAKVVNATVKFNAKSIEVYKDGKLVETITLSNGKLAYTGNSVNAILVVSSVAIIALVAVVTRKKIANA